MKTLAIALAAASVGLAACTPGLPASNSASASATNSLAPGHWDSVTISGSTTATDLFIKDNIDTGAASINCCGNFNFAPITDPAPLPAGAYHLLAWYVIASDGSVRWEAYRTDHNTGHTWELMQDPNDQYRWQAITN
jgi:hypothetical protein